MGHGHFQAVAAHKVGAVGIQQIGEPHGAALLGQFVHDLVGGHAQGHRAKARLVMAQVALAFFDLQLGAQYLRHAKSRGFITSGGLGTMGFGYGAAIGAQMALGRDQRVVMFTGDGSFHMNLNEACTAVSYDLPIITVIFNNSVLGMVRQWQTTFYGKRYSQTDPHRHTDFVKLAEGFGLKGYRCTNLPEFQQAFAEALQRKGPTWIECIIDKDEKVLPMIPGGGDINDIIME